MAMGDPSGIFKKGALIAFGREHYPYPEVEFTPRHEYMADRLFSITPERYGLNTSGQARVIASERRLQETASLRYSAEEYSYRIGAHLSSMQHEVGVMLVDELMRMGPSLVYVRLETMTDHAPPFFERMELRALVQPTGQHVEQITYPIYVAHGVYFPKDWRCEKCGCIVDGLNHPRMCSQCNAPRSVRNV